MDIKADEIAPVSDCITTLMSPLLSVWTRRNPRPRLLLPEQSNSRDRIDAGMLLFSVFIFDNLLQVFESQFITLQESDKSNVVQIAKFLLGIVAPQLVAELLDVAAVKVGHFVVLMPVNFQCYAVISVVKI